MYSIRTALHSEIANMTIPFESSPLCNLQCPPADKLSLPMPSFSPFVLCIVVAVCCCYAGASSSSSSSAPRHRHHIHSLFPLSLCAVCVRACVRPSISACVFVAVRFRGEPARVITIDFSVATAADTLCGTRHTRSVLYKSPLRHGRAHIESTHIHTGDTVAICAAASARRKETNEKKPTQTPADG